MSERRDIGRKRSYLGGKIVFNHEMSTIDCLVRNLSDKGATLEFCNSVAVPGEFELLVEPAGRAYSGQIVWRQKDKIGVRFKRDCA